MLASATRSSCMRDAGGDVRLLPRAALVLLCVHPATVGELEDEHLASACEDGGHLCGDHADILVSLHDFLDAGKQHVVALEIGGGLDLAVLLRPEDLELLLHRGALLVWLGSGRVRDGARLEVRDGRRTQWLAVMTLMTWRPRPALLPREREEARSKEATSGEPCYRELSMSSAMRRAARMSGT
jgi:hypothetical protein